jgi:hypothetical protein
MLGFKLVEKLHSRACSILCYFGHSLTNAFLGVGASCDVEQSLIGFRVPHSSGLSIYREHDRALGLFKLFHKVAGCPAKSCQRLYVARDVNHIGLYGIEQFVARVFRPG